MGSSDHQNIKEDGRTEEETYNCKRPTWTSQVGIEVKKNKIKELTEGHHQEWSLWLNLTQHEKSHQVQT